MKFGHPTFTFWSFLRYRNLRSSDASRNLFIIRSWIRVSLGEPWFGLWLPQSISAHVPLPRQWHWPLPWLPLKVATPAGKHHDVLAENRWRNGFTTSLASWSGRTTWLKECKRLSSSVSALSGEGFAWYSVERAIARHRLLSNYYSPWNVPSFQG